MTRCDIAVLSACTSQNYLTTYQHKRTFAHNVSKHSLHSAILVGSRLGQFESLGRWKHTSMNHFHTRHVSFLLLQVSFFPLIASRRNPWAFMNARHCHFHTRANAYPTPQKPPLSDRIPYPRRDWAVARRRPPINSHVRRTNIARFFIPRMVCFCVCGGISEMDTWSWMLGIVLHLRLRRN